jgi:hypothetical protein
LVAPFGITESIVTKCKEPLQDCSFRAIRLARVRLYLFFQTEIVLKHPWRKVY